MMAEKLTLREMREISDKMTRAREVGNDEAQGKAMMEAIGHLTKEQLNQLGEFERSIAVTRLDQAEALVKGVKKRRKDK
jgi:hypothetical protein